jgi:serine/threonine protein kinase
VSALPNVKRLGRFELRRLLGKGAQATVWLAHDPRLEREVAVKLLNTGSDAQAVNEWLHEARAVSRLTHPNIVPVFEADQQGGAAYLVFEYVAGSTLADSNRAKGRWPAREAVALVVDVLDALAAAHAQGIVHRDLKPSNILLGTDGRPRVMDFGIAARMATPSGSDILGIVGTPGYISPEAARGAAPLPAMDVFSAGVVLGELLAGAPLLRESDALLALKRVQEEDLELPADVDVDDRLRGVLQRALSRDAAKRFDDAQAFKAALSQWLEPAVEPEAPVISTGNGTLDFLLRRMRHKGDFPALSESVLRIQRVVNSETESLATLSAEILKDVALTNKLLRMVNTAHFSTKGGSVSTISRAVALVGFAGIRNMAMSLVLLDHMRDKAHAALLREEFLRALMAGTLADELTPNTRDGEEAFIGSMFQNLGRLLTEYYFPEEAQQIRRLLPPGEVSPPQRDAVAQKVLGISFDELGAGIAKHWHLPDNLQQTMRFPPGAAPNRAVPKGTERQRWAGRAGNELVDAMLLLEGEELAKRLDAISDRFAAALALPAADIVEAAQSARQRLSSMAEAMGISATQGGRAKRLMQAAAPPADTITPHQLQPTAVLPETATGDAEAERGRMADMLAAGIQDITNSMVDENFKLNEVLRMVLETMFRALGFHRVVFCLRDPRADALTGRFGLGEGVDSVAKLFKVPLKLGQGADLFAAVCAKGMDTLIADSQASNIHARLPAWYRQGVNAPAFLLLPLQMKGASFALIYADKMQAGALNLGEKELSLLRTLRNQAVMAFRQRGAA